VDRKYAETMALRLRPYGQDDESDALAAHEALLADDFHFLLGWDATTSWSDFLHALNEQRRGVNLAENRVRAVQLVAEADGELVGRVSVRFELNDFLATTGGHIGYAVVPAHRKKGFATEMLRQALVVIRAEGVDRVLITCLNGNAGSRRVIENCGGKFESVVPLEEGQTLCIDNGEGVRRYWIE
jgi:predicted acetyltransferase